MGTSFTAAALGSEGIASTARMLIGSGYASDRGDYALQLLRASRRLRAAFEEVA
jgi:L-erythro-3,5-diaminohexanoate dehydrogenase